VCGNCRSLSVKQQAGDDVAEAVLYLPVPGKGSVQRHDRGDGPLRAAGGETDGLVNDVREILGVH
jgi:hypothetical protein